MSQFVGTWPQFRCFSPATATAFQSYFDGQKFMSVQRGSIKEEQKTKRTT